MTKKEDEVIRDLTGTEISNLYSACQAITQTYQTSAGHQLPFVFAKGRVKLNMAVNNKRLKAAWETYQEGLDQLKKANATDGKDEVDPENKEAMDRVNKEFADQLKVKTKVTLRTFDEEHLELGKHPFPQQMLDELVRHDLINETPDPEAAKGPKKIQPAGAPVIPPTPEAA